MQSLDKNYVSFDTSNETKYLYFFDKIKSNTEELQEIFGVSKKDENGVNKYKFKMDRSKFVIYKKNKEWYLASNTNNKNKIHNFLIFIGKARLAVHTARKNHTAIPVYTSKAYQLKGKIALYRIPPIEPPSKITIYKEKRKIAYKNKNGNLMFDDYPEFNPNRTPKEVLQAGSFGGTYFRSILSGITGKRYVDVWKEFPEDWFENLDIDKSVTSQVVQASVNKYNVKMGGRLDMWESSGWITNIDPYGWFQWYCRFYLGRRSSDDIRQIKRWLRACGPNGRFKTKLIKLIISKKTSYNDCNIGAANRQGMLHWGYELTKKDFLDYKKKIEYKAISNIIK